MHRPKLFLFFIDGIGIGSNNPQRNPLIQLGEAFLGPAAFHSGTVPLRSPRVWLLPIDANLGVSGRPQSATGQTSFMTGINAAQKLGYHLQAFPNEQLLPIISSHNLLKVLVQNGVRATSANLYSHKYFTDRRKRRKNMFPVSTLSIESAGIPFRYYKDYRLRRAIFADITNQMLKDRGFSIKPIAPKRAASHVLNIFKRNDLVFFEYFLTDTYGHARKAAAIRHCVANINAFIRALWEQSKERIDILIISDHGNAEDMEIGDHTLNPVPFFFISSQAEKWAADSPEPHSLLDIKPFILSYYGIT
ncbi:MAG: hypothetical protein ACOCXF_01780 [bacterium]